MGDFRLKVRFSGVSSGEIFKAIEERLDGRKLGSLVSLNLEGSELMVTVSKLGTSKIRFEVIEETTQDEGLCTTLCLLDKKIPWAHKVLEKELARKLTDIIQQSGGDVLEPYAL